MAAINSFASEQQQQQQRLAIGSSNPTMLKSLSPKHRSSGTNLAAGNGGGRSSATSSPHHGSPMLPPRHQQHHSSQQQLQQQQHQQMQEQQQIQQQLQQHQQNHQMQQQMQHQQHQQQLHHQSLQNIGAAAGSMGNLHRSSQGQSLFSTSNSDLHHNSAQHHHHLHMDDGQQMESSTGPAGGGSELEMLSSMTSEQQLCMLYNAQQHSDYIISDYMDKIATRINILETELKFAWRALDLLSGEYGKMWNRLEKLENITVEQQSVVGNIMELYGRRGGGGGGAGAGLSAGMSGGMGGMLFGGGSSAAGEQHHSGGYGGGYHGGPVDEMEDDGTVAPTQQPNEPSANEFNDMLEDLKNDALDANMVLIDNYNKMMPPMYDPNDAYADGGRIIGFDELATSVNEAHLIERYGGRGGSSAKIFEEYAPDSGGGGGKLANDKAAITNALLLRDFLGGSHSIKDGLEEGIDLMQRERLKQKYRDVYRGMGAAAADELFKTQLDNRIRSEADFFRSGELNRDIFSSSDEGDGGGVGAKPNIIIEGVFYRQTNDGGGGRIEDTGGGEAGSSEMSEDFYRSLNQAYREDVPLESLSEHIITAAASTTAPSSRPVSSLGMIYEDNEEQEPEHQSSASEVDEYLHFGDVKREPLHINVPIQHGGAALPVKPTPLGAKKSKKKKHHRNDLEILNNIKSAIAGDQIVDGIIQPKSSTNTTSTSSSSSTTTTTTTIINMSPTSREEHIAVIIREIGKVEDLTLFSDTQRANLRQLIVKEFDFFGKIKKINKNLILLLLNPISRSDSFDEVDVKYKQLLEKLQKNIEIIKKLLGNDYQTMGSIADFKTSQLDELDAATPLPTTTLASYFDTTDPLKRSRDGIYASATSFSTAPKGDDYSANLLQHNSNLNEQLKLLDSKENEIMCKKSLKNINSTSGSCYNLSSTAGSILDTMTSTRNNLLDNFDETAIIGGDHTLILDDPLIAQLNLTNAEKHFYFMKSHQQQQQYEQQQLQYQQLQLHQEQMDLYGGGVGILGSMSSGLTGTTTTSTHYSSNSSIYSNDEYIKSLKKSLERHNSMLFLLHLQNPNYRGADGQTPAAKSKEEFALVDDDRISSGSQSPPPPAPNGDHGGAPEAKPGMQQPISAINPFHADIMMMQQQQQLQHQQNQQLLLRTTVDSVSPKKTKSDSGLSSMSGFSSLEKSPNSPGHVVMKPPRQFYGLTASGTSSGDEKAELARIMMLEQQHQQDQQQDFMFSEENLNYIRELSQNVPICSAYENKSIFDAANVSAQQHRAGDASRTGGAGYQLSAAQFMKLNYPDLVQNEASGTRSREMAAPSPSRRHRSHQSSDSGGYYDVPAMDEDNDSYRRNPPQLPAHQSIAAPKQHHRLTDRLAFYPSSSNITDYNSSMNLDYTEDGRRLQQMYAMKAAQSAAAQSQQIYHQSQHQYQQPQHQSQQQQHQDPRNFTHLDRHQQNIKQYMTTGVAAAAASRGAGATSYRRQVSQPQPQQSYILNQAGYVTIACDLKGRGEQQQAINTYQQQSDTTASTTNNGKYMNKLSQWFPDLKLKKISKRHRSHSLPIGAENDDDLVAVAVQPQQPPIANGGSTSQPPAKPAAAQHPKVTRKDSSSSWGMTSGSTASKKKKRSLVSTMSNIMQKAKIYRRHSFTHHSLTNPFSGHQHLQHAGSVGAATGAKKYGSRAAPASLSDPEGDIHGFYSDNDDTTSTSEYEKQSLDEYGGAAAAPPEFMMVQQHCNGGPASTQDVKVTVAAAPMFQQMERPKPAAPQPEPLVDSDAESVPGQDDDAVYDDFEDDDGEIFMNPMFAMVGDTKKPQSGGETTSGGEEITSKCNPPTPSPDPTSSSCTTGGENGKFIFSSTSMEFAVSRKIAKYRQKNVSSDDINGQKQIDEYDDESSSPTQPTQPPPAQSVQEIVPVLPIIVATTTTPAATSRPQLEHQKSTAHLGQLQKSHSIFVDEDLPLDPEPEFHSAPKLLDDSGASFASGSKSFKFIQQPQQRQQSLDIPSRDDEDNRSQHSYRTMSSSRRQSTEDSIDTDDEYFCYELRKLEELERRSHMESATYYEEGNGAAGGTVEQSLLTKIDQLAMDEDDDEYSFLNNEPAASYQPDDTVKVKMSNVLRELKAVVKVHPEIKINNVRRRSDAKQTKKSDIYSKFAHASDLSWQQPAHKTYEDDDDDDDEDYMGEITQFEQEIGAPKRRTKPAQVVAAVPAGKPVKIRKKRRKSKTAIDAYDSDDADQYSTSPYSSEDGAQITRRRQHLNDDASDGSDDSAHLRVKSRNSSGATSGPDSPCHQTDDDQDTVEAFKNLEDYADFKERQRDASLATSPNQQQHMSASKNDAAISPSKESDGERELTTDEQRQLELLQAEAALSGASSSTGTGEIGAAQTKRMNIGKMLSHESSQDSANGGAGALGSSKWKLLKTLKEKKIEEKNNQEKIKEEEKVEKDKVSICWG